ncbi:MAG: carboxypeptidase regulatory-like domain-containing protein [Acidobacteria bacterium]|nr:carboxypeptidase regulatory-like domain-containing protein [Acidobacteriota bacterium]
MKPRYLAIVAVWSVSLVGVGLWAQGSGSRTFAVDQTAARPLTSTGTVEGRVVDPSGGAIPGARIVLINESNGTRSAPVVSNPSGVFSVTTVAPGSYTIEVTMRGFRTVRRPGVAVGNDRVVVSMLTLEPGGGPRVIPIPPMPVPGHSIDAAIISGADIGFLPVASPNTPAGVVTGRLMVRINGEWHQASAAMQVRPAL